jgi:5-formyltetrahydrofolate cyclo-ligase
MTELSKKELRSLLRQRRRSLPVDAQRDARKQVALLAFTLPQWANAQKIGLYCDTDGEIGTADIAKRCHADKKAVFLPVTGTANSLTFKQWDPNAKLVQSEFGIFEPTASAALCPIASLDIVFLPLVGWDKSGGRLGMGGGYYDRVLCGVSGPLVVGLAHQIQEVERVPLDSWDIALDAIVTGQAIYRL